MSKTTFLYSSGRPNETTERGMKGKKRDLKKQIIIEEGKKREREKEKWKT